MGLCSAAVTVRAFNISFHFKRIQLKLAIVLILLLAQKVSLRVKSFLELSSWTRSHYCEKNQTSWSFRWNFVLWSGNRLEQELIEVRPWGRLTVAAWLGGVFLTRGHLRDTSQFLLGACGQPSGSTEPGINLARKAVLSDFCALEHISKTGWSAVIRVEIVFLTLKIILVCHFTGIVDVIELREAQSVSQSIVLLKLRKTALV